MPNPANNHHATPTSAWTLRPVTPADAGQIAFHATYDDGDYSLRRGLYAEWVRVRIEAGQYVGWFACSDEKVIGGAGAVLLEWGPTRANPGGQMGRVNNVFTHEAWRRQGVGRALVQAVMAQCEALGVREFNLAATQSGRGLYEGLGFVSYAAEMRRRVPLD